MAPKRCYGCMQLKNQSPVCEHCGFNEHVPNESHQLPCGTVLRGQYLIGKVLGQGGFGITYMGWDLNLEMPIAIKEYYPNGVVSRDGAQNPAVTLARKSMDDSYRMNKERFLREARALARLRDIPEVVHVYNFFEENNTAYIIMEYIRGTDLRHYIRQRGGRLTAQESLPLLQPVMQALEKVHEAELVHRDISPDNIMLLPGGKTKLLDFGAVREVADADAEKALSSSTEAILKHGFAPMEQYQKRGSLGPWTDVYALCGTLYYCMTGQVPPDAPARMMEDEHPRWETVPGLNDRQRRILAAGMALRAKDRIRSVKHLRQELDAAAGEQPAPQNAPQPVSAPVKQTAYPVGTLSLEEEAAVSAKTEPVQKQPVYTLPVEAKPVQEKPLHTVPVQQKTPKKKKGWLIGLVAAVLAVVIGIAAFGTGNTEAPQEQKPWRENVLVYDPISVCGIDRTKIRTVTFYDTLDNGPNTCWDVSDAGDSSVVAWTETDGVYYDLYIAADGGINGKNACPGLFRGCRELERVEFNGIFHTEEATSMRNMFDGCEKLTYVDVSGFNTRNVRRMNNLFYNCALLRSVDLSNFDTAGVKDMGGMFYGCKSLTELDVSNFDTSACTDMSFMFSTCKSLKSLDLRNFDTSQVENMQSMFQNCYMLREVDVGSFDTSNVTKMGAMFNGCKALRRLDLRHFDTSKVVSVEYMFFGCGELEELNITGWDLSMVEKYDSFMDSGRTINGKPWEEFFQ